MKTTQDDRDEFVEGGEGAEVESVLFGGTKDESEFLAWGASTEEEGHYECMGETDLGSVDNTIAETLKHHQPQKWDSKDVSTF